MNHTNRFVCTGRLTRDPQTKFTSTDKQVTEFGIAINRKWGGKEETTFLECETWGNTAKYVADYCGKGREVALEGRLKLESWDKDGERRSRLKVVAESIRGLGGGKSEAPQTSQPDQDYGSDDEAPF